MEEKNINDLLGIGGSGDNNKNIPVREDHNLNYRSPKNKPEQEGKSYISLIGGAVALFSFFAPWVGCDDQTISGYDLGDDKWFAFVAAGVIIGAFFFFLNAKKLEKAKPFILISSIFGIVYMLYLFIEMQGNEFAKHLEVKWGGITTVGGFILGLVGVQFLESAKQPAPKMNDEQKMFCEGCGKKYKEKNIGEFCEECGNKL